MIIRFCDKRNLQETQTIRHLRKRKVFARKKNRDLIMLKMYEKLCKQIDLLIPKFRISLALNEWFLWRLWKRLKFVFFLRFSILCANSKKKSTYFLYFYRWTFQNQEFCSSCCDNDCIYGLERDGHIDIRKRKPKFVSTDKVIKSFMGFESVIKTVTTYLHCECSKHISWVKFHPFQYSAEIDIIQKNE